MYALTFSLFLLTFVVCVELGLERVDEAGDGLSIGSQLIAWEVQVNL
jgi:hypothetical protein